MKRFLTALVALLLVSGFPATPAFAQTMQAKTVTACGTPGNTPVVGVPYPVTQDTTGVLCTSSTGGGGGGGTASFTAAAAPFSVGAGANKAAGISTTNSAQWIVPVKPGTTTEVDLSAPSAIIGADGSTIASTSNPVPTQGQTQTDTVMLGGVNVKEINGVAPLMGNGVTGTGSPRVTIASDNTAFSVNATLQAGSAIVGKAGIDQTTNGTTNGVVEKPATTGGLLACTFEVAASDNHQNCGTGAAHQVYAVQGYSIHTAAMFMRLYNAASFNGCNSATNLVWEGQIPAPGTTGGGFVLTFPTGLAFSSGIGVCVTGAFGNTNTTSATASVASVNIQYQ